MIIGRGELLGMIGLTGKVNGYLPVLNCVLLKEREGKLSFAWTDLTTSIQVKQDIREDGGRKIKVAVPQKMLQESLELLSDSGIIVELDKRGVRISDRKTESMIKVASCIEEKEFPIIPGRIKGREKEVELAELLRGLKKVVFAASDDEARNNLWGVYVESFPDRLDLTAADGYEVANYTIPGEFGRDSFLVPTKAVTLLLKLKGERVKMRRRNRLVQFEVGGILETVSINRDLTFPKWRNVVSVQGHQEVVLPKAELVKALKIAAKINVASTFSFSGKNAIVETENEERKVRQEIPCHGRHEVTIKLGTKRLIEGIRQVEGDQVEMGLKKENEPIMIREGNYRYHLMPIQQK